MVSIWRSGEGQSAIETVWSCYCWQKITFLNIQPNPSGFRSEIPCDQRKSSSFSRQSSQCSGPSWYLITDHQQPKFRLQRHNLCFGGCIEKNCEDPMIRQEKKVIGAIRKLLKSPKSHPKKPHFFLLSFKVNFDRPLNRKIEECPSVHHSFLAKWDDRSNGYACRLRNGDLWMRGVWESDISLGTTGE
jgi:hypothetical protein